MSGQQDQADPEVLGGGNAEEVMPNLDSDMDTPVADNDWTLAGIDKDLTPLQYHYLSLFQRLVTLKNTYQTDPDYEAWMMVCLFDVARLHRGQRGRRSQRDAQQGATRKLAGTTTCTRKKAGANASAFFFATSKCLKVLRTCHLEFSRGLFALHCVFPLATRFLSFRGRRGMTEVVVAF